MEYRGNKIFSNCADEFFGNDLYDDFYIDNYVLRATLRYVSLKHFVAADSILKCYIRMRRSSGDAGKDYIENIAPNTINIFVNRNKDDVVCKIEEEGWVALDKVPYPVSSFLSNPRGVIANVYANIEKKTAIIFVNKVSSTWFDLLAQTLPKILLWIYPANVREIDPNEFALYQAIHNGDSEKFTNIIDTQYDASNIEALWVKKQMHGWANIGVTCRITECKNTINSCDNYIADYMRKINDYLNTRAQLNQEVIALSMSKNEDDDSFWDFFNKHKQLEFVSISNVGNSKKVMTFCIIDTLEYFDKSELKRLLQNKNSFIYDYANERILTVLKAIFIEEKAKIRTRACFRMTNTSALESYKEGIDWGSYSDALKHPHLGEFNCLGGNEAPIVKAMSKGDWEIAIEQAIAATKNIAFGDTPVMSRFLGHLDPNNNTKRCVITNDGEELTIKEFYEAYISEQKEKETTETSGENNE